MGLQGRMTLPKELLTSLHHAPPPFSPPTSPTSWRIKERMRTSQVGLVLALNIGVDPPDVIKTSPSAKLECWVDPFALQPQHALEQIGRNLQQQYERWQPKARYRQSLDPTVEDVKKLCLHLRRSAKEERVLFHYNGHGVPKPTTNGEIWVFNKNYTQYIPLSIVDLQHWLGAPALYIFDCSHAGLLVSNTLTAAKGNIILAACQAHETLPMNPDFPADLFTSCITTPIKTALRWFCLDAKLRTVSIDLIDQVPGKVNERQTPLGELSWIFTAITDSIAWSTLPADLFQRLFRQDLLLASVVRNYLLAERIMKSAHCTPKTWPDLPSTHQHPMWAMWDLAVDLCLSQVVEYVASPTEFQFKSSHFFSEQLTAFEVWLDLASSQSPHHTRPQQLPIVLQVLLSQTHRFRALQLLARFLDLGPWAVQLALSVGIFPYILRLLQSPAPELRHVMVFIWAKILSVDLSCQADLIKVYGHLYFIQLLNTSTSPTHQKAIAFYVIALACRGYPTAQQACLSNNMLTICTQAFTSMTSELRQWSCLCLAMIWEAQAEIKMTALREEVHLKTIALLKDNAPDVRASAVHALTLFLGDSTESRLKLDADLRIATEILMVGVDACSVVRREVVFFIGTFVYNYEALFEYSILTHLQMHERTPADQASFLPPISDYKITSPMVLPSSPISITKSDVDSVESKQLYPAMQCEACVCLWRLGMLMANDAFEDIRVACRDFLTMALALARARVYHQPLQPATPSEIIHPSYSDPDFKASLLLLSTMSHTPSSDTSTPIRKANSFTDFARMTSPKPLKARPLPPSPFDYRMRDLGLVGTDEFALRDMIDPTVPFEQLRLKPLQSTLFDRCSAIFHYSQNEVDWTLPENTHKLSQQNKYNAMCQNATQLSQLKGTEKFHERIGMENDSEMTSMLLFHPIDPILAVANERDEISLWNYETGSQTRHFSNQNRQSSRITALHYVNPSTCPLLLTGTDDGTVRIWNHESPTLIQAWRAVPNLKPGSRGPGLVVDWNQETAMVLASGRPGSLYVWDIEKELCVREVLTGADLLITSLAHDPTQPNISLAGCGDGTLRIYDVRCAEGNSLVGMCQGHRSWVVRLGAQMHGQHQVLSGEVFGDVKFWDVRTQSCLRTVEAHRTALTALDTHHFAPVFATGSRNQTIKVFGHDGHTISMIRFHDGFLGRRVSPVSCLTFHPTKLIFAAGFTDSIISVYHTENDQSQLLM